MMLTLAYLLPSSDHGLNCKEACCSEKEKIEMSFFSFPFLGQKKIKRTVSRPEHSWSEVKVAQSCLTLCNPMDYMRERERERERENIYIYSAEQNTGMGSLSLLQQIFPTQEVNRGLLHCRWILYQLSYQGSPDRDSLKSKQGKVWTFLVVLFCFALTAANSAYL